MSAPLTAGQDLSLLLLFKLQAPFQSMEASRLPSALSFVTQREMMQPPEHALSSPAPPCNLLLPLSLLLTSALIFLRHAIPLGVVATIEAEESSAGLLVHWAAYLGLGHSACVGGMTCASWPPWPLPKRCLKPPSLPCGHDNQNVSRLRLRAGVKLNTGGLAWLPRVDEIEFYCQILHPEHILTYNMIDPG